MGIRLMDILTRLIFEKRERILAQMALISIYRSAETERDGRIDKGIFWRYLQSAACGMARLLVLTSGAFK